MIDNMFSFEMPRHLRLQHLHQSPSTGPPPGCRLTAWTVEGRFISKDATILPRQ
jgi:hypothetical protein